MPQFDISSYIVQLIWVFLSLLTFYFVFSWSFLPSWAILIKTRKKCISTYTLNKTVSTSFFFKNFNTKIVKDPHSEFSYKTL